MSKNIRTQIGKVIGKTLNSYHARVKPIIDDLKFKEQYQGRIIDCMVGEVDDNYIETPETDSAIVKLEHSKEGLVKVPSIKGKTILVDSEGNETDTPTEGCRLVSVGEEEDNKLIILSKNKNLFDGEFEVGKGLMLETGYIGFNSKRFVTKNFIRVEENSTYRLSINDGVYRPIRTFFYDKNKKFMDYNSTSYITQIPNGVYYILMDFTRVDQSDITISNINNVNLQLEKNNLATSYTKGLSYKTEILLQEPLRSLPNGVCDEIIGNKIIRRVSKIILNGNEDWVIRNHLGNGYKINRFAIQNDYLNIYPIGDHQVNAISTDYEVIPSIESQDNTKIGLVVNGGTHNWRLMVMAECKNVNEFKEWLSKHNISFYCQLAEPIIEEFPNGITLQGFDDTTMYIENSLTPTVSYGYNALIPYKEELRTQKEEVEINTLDIENNIIPYLMDMEFNLMLMEDNE